MNVCLFYCSLGLGASVDCCHYGDQSLVRGLCGQVVRLYNVVDIVVMAGDVACCSVVCGTLVSVVCGTLVSVSVFSIICNELLIMSTIS